MNHFQQAIGYLDLGMFQEAWDSLEALPPEQRAHPEVFAMRVRILLAMGKLDSAQVVANGMASQIPGSGLSWLTLARVHAAQGDLLGAREGLRKAFELEKNLRLEALEDPIFESVW